MATVRTSRPTATATATATATQPPTDRGHGPHARAGKARREARGFPGRGADAAPHAAALGAGDPLGGDAHAARPEPDHARELRGRSHGRRVVRLAEPARRAGGPPGLSPP